MTTMDLKLSKTVNNGRERERYSINDIVEVNDDYDGNDNNDASNNSNHLENYSN